MANDDPFEKSTPDACNTALPENLSAPEGSTILLKFENGLPPLLLGGRLTGVGARLGRPAPRPAPAAPPLTLTSPLISLSLKDGFARLAATPWPPARARVTDVGIG